MAADLGPAGSGVGRVGFGSRVGGISEDPYDTLNIGVLTDDADAAVVENRRRLAAAVGIEPRNVPIGLQVHKADLAIHSGAQDPSPFADEGLTVNDDGRATLLSRSCAVARPPAV